MTNNFQDFENAKILVIDDEVVNLDIIEELLERDGFSNVSFFSDPSEAVKFYKNTPPDLVILDLNMPVLTGFDVMQLFKEINHNPQPPVLVLTAQNDRKIRLQALQEGARDFLSKPFDDEEVAQRVRNLLEMHLAHKKTCSIHMTLKVLCSNGPKTY